MNKNFGRLLVLLMFVILAVAYTWPGASYLASTDSVMSDNTDLVPSPLLFGIAHETYLKTPALFFFGGMARSMGLRRAIGLAALCFLGAANGKALTFV